MRHLFLVFVLIFLAATHGAATSLSVSGNTAAEDLAVPLFDLQQELAVEEPTDRCCMKEQIEDLSSKTACNADCTYFLMDVEVDFPDRSDSHDTLERGWLTPDRFSPLFRPPIA
jgi:hypothetical protein